MTRHKGVSTKSAVTVEDLAVVVDCYRRIQNIHAGMHYNSAQKMPLMAASATLKACWAELSGAQAATGWSYPDWAVKAPDLDKPPEEKRYMKRFGLDD